MGRLQESSAGIKQSATRDSWMVVIEDIKGNTTITQVRGDQISHETCKYPNRGEGAHLHLLGDVLAPAWGESL